jgi:DNA-binding transcriptional ArsR family regulator
MTSNQIYMKNNTCLRIFADKTQINSCREKVKANSTTFEQLGKILELAGNVVRLKIIYLLEEENELCPCDISDILGMSIPAISQHLRKLKDGNVIESRRSGQTIFYSLKEEHLKILKPFFKYIDQNNLKKETI